MPNLVEGIAQAIATMEGFYSPGKIAQRNNNPGNLRSWGSAPTANGYAKFNSPQEGWAALYSQIQTNIGRNLTLQEFFAGKPGVYAGYAPAKDGNKPLQYAAYVANRIGVPANVRLSTVITGTVNIPPVTIPQQTQPTEQVTSTITYPSGDGDELIVGDGSGNGSPTGAGFPTASGATGAPTITNALASILPKDDSNLPLILLGAAIVGLVLLSD